MTNQWIDPIPHHQKLKNYQRGQTLFSTHEVDNLLSKNCKMEQKAGSFYMIKDKEKGRNK